MSGEPVSLGALSPQELMEVRQSLETELRTMQQNGVTLQSTAGKFAAAGQAVEYLQDQKQGEIGLLQFCRKASLQLECEPAVGLPRHASCSAAASHPSPSCPPPPAGQPVLLPLTESLYVSGTLESVDSVLLEAGTGYYVEVRVLPAGTCSSSDGGCAAVTALLASF